MANFLTWVQTGLQEGLTIELHDVNHRGQVKAFVTVREVNSHTLYFLTLISVAEEHRLTESLKLHQLVFENTQEAIFITDKYFNIQHVNPAYTKVCGYTLNEMVGKKPSIHCENYTDVEKYTELFQAANSMGSATGIIKANHKEQSSFYQRLTLTVVFPEDDFSQIPLHYIGIFENIDEQVEKETLLHTLAEQDPLTTLYNRQGFELHFDELFQEAQREGENLALFFRFR
ncbi:PAS domain S-box protein [Psychromonas sp. KJ10-10]|uniref:PAS domain S-box protein n=1 Tax=Psychromonas sp. KJ10-10 TaxID=3391823 RepID=UPI0039B45C04